MLYLIRYPKKALRFLPRPPTPNTGRHDDPKQLASLFQTSKRGCLKQRGLVHDPDLGVASAQIAQTDLLSADGQGMI